jgi:hypothetical protein
MKLGLEVLNLRLLEEVADLGNNDYLIQRDATLFQLLIAKLAKGDRTKFKADQSLQQLLEQVVEQCLIEQCLLPPVIINSSSGDKSFKNVSEPEKKAVPEIMLVNTL